MLTRIANGMGSQTFMAMAPTRKGAETTERLDPPAGDGVSDGTPLGQAAPTPALRISEQGDPLPDRWAGFDSAAVAAANPPRPTS
jgi:hypothetical protein